MHLYISTLLLLAATALSQTKAPVIQHEPKGAAYEAMLQTDKPVQGQIVGVSSTTGTGIQFNVDFYAFPSGGAPFGEYDPTLHIALYTPILPQHQPPLNIPQTDHFSIAYHIHQKPVPANGDCAGTGAHLDPYYRTESPPCNPKSPATCQLGDLSGKHGAITASESSSSFQKLYTDNFLSSQPGALSFFGNRSLVVHNAKGVRINCGNFTNVGVVAPKATAYSATMVPKSTGKGSMAMTAPIGAATTANAGGRVGGEDVLAWAALMAGLAAM